MEELKQILEQANIAIPADLEAQVKALGYKPDRISGEECIAIAKTIIAQSSGAIAHTQQGKATRSKGGKATRATRNERTPNPGAGLQRAAAQVDLELGAFREEISRGAEEYSEVAAEDILAIVAEIPNRTLAKIDEKAGGYQGDAEHFRQRGKAFANALFGFSASDAAE